MNKNDDNIVKWLEQEMSHEENLPDEDSLRSQSLSRSPSRPPTEHDSSDDDIPLSRLHSRRRPRKENYFGANRFRWASAPNIARSRTPQHNIIQQTPGIKPVFRSILNNSTTPLDIWSLLFSD